MKNVVFLLLPFLLSCLPQPQADAKSTPTVVQQARPVPRDPQTRFFGRVLDGCTMFVSVIVHREVGQQRIVTDTLYGLALLPCPAWTDSSGALFYEVGAR